MQKVN